MDRTKNKKTMNRKSHILLCLGISVGLLAGCGGEYAGLAEGDAVSGSAVSGEAVSGDAIQEKTVSGPAVNEEEGENAVRQKSVKKAGQDMSSHRFCTDTNLYYVSEDAKKLMQARTDGTHHGCIREYPTGKGGEKYVEIVYVDDNWLYYNITFAEGGMAIYRTPIEKDAQGYDVVKFMEEEELVKEEMIVPVYVDSDYYFYENYVDNEEVKYDLKTKKKVSEDKTQKYGAIFRVKDYYIGADYEGLYVQKVDSNEWEKVVDYVLEFDIDIVIQNTKAVFYPCSAMNNIYPFSATLNKSNRRFYIKRYDGKQERDFVTWEELNQAVKEAAGVKKLDICVPDQLFWQEERLYIQMQTGWIKDGTYHMGYMIFSQKENEDGSGSGLRYEKELTECMKSHVKERTGKWIEFDDPEDTAYVEHMVINTAKCIAMVEGKAYLSLYDYKKDKGRLACYDLTTGKFKWIGKQDAAFYKLGYDFGHLYSDFEEVFEQYDDNVFVEYWACSPSKDKNDDGYFVED